MPVATVCIQAFRTGHMLPFGSWVAMLKVMGPVTLEPGEALGHWEQSLKGEAKRLVSVFFTFLAMR